jgi:hypothetical protein
MPSPRAGTRPHRSMTNSTGRFCAPPSHGLRASCGCVPSAPILDFGIDLCADQQDNIREPQPDHKTNDSAKRAQTIRYFAAPHRHRSIPGYNRILYLRRKIGAELRPFSEIPPRPRSHTRYHRIVAEIRALEERLIGHLRTDVNDALERRVRLRGMLRE